MALEALKSTAIIGVLVSMYAWQTERAFAKDPSHKALCDINDRMSCSRAFTSTYGRIAGISNALLGTGFFLVFLGLTFLLSPRSLIILAGLSVLGSLILAYFSYVKMRNFCIVCSVIYLINILLLLFSILRA